jgi:hypothetical protein
MPSPQPDKSLSNNVASVHGPEHRFLQAQFDRTIVVGTHFEVAVRIAVQSSGRVSVALDRLQMESLGTTIHIGIHCPCFECLSDRQQKIVVPAESHSEWITFTLRAERTGMHGIELSAYCGGSYLGVLQDQILVSSESVRRASENRIIPLGVPRHDIVSATLTARYDRGNKVYRYQFNVGDALGEELVSKELVQTPEQAVEGVVSELNLLARGMVDYSNVEAREIIRSKGIELWDLLVPETLQREILKAREQVSSLTIVSDRDPVPWELLYPLTKDGDDNGFLTEQMPIFRWIFGPKRIARIPLVKANFVLPEGSPDSAEEEIEALQTLFAKRASTEPAIQEFVPLLDLLRAARFTSLHFACHNRFELDRANTSVIVMGNRDFPVSAITEFEIKQAFQSLGPLVFMNACRTAGQAPTYTQLSGWARSFVRAGVGAFIGTLWEVRDTTARVFASTFYASLLEGETLAEALSNARRKVRDEPVDPTWLAYTIYGDPTATLK